MEELIGRYFFIVIVIFATVLDLVGRWYKNRQQHDRRPRRPTNIEAREQADWRQRPARGPERELKREPRSESGSALGSEPTLPAFAQILLDELAPPESWTQIRRPESSTPVEQPLVARVVPKRQPAPLGKAQPAGRVSSAPRVRRRLRMALEDPRAARRAVMLAEVLGPCRGLELYGQKE